MEQDTAVASHTLTCLRKLDRQSQNLTELVVRQRDLIGRLDRNHWESLDNLRCEVRGVRRDVRGVKSDMVPMENRIVSAHSTDRGNECRLTELEERPAAASSGSTFKPSA